MNYIYCITNIINNKRYIGKTTLTLEKRFREHCLDSRRERCNKRPLYDAMNKYGVENFIIEELELVEDEAKLEEREIYWIQELQTYGSNGYNATKGGDGKILYDYKEIVELYNLGYNTNKISNLINCDTTTVRKVLLAHGIKSRRQSSKINLYDLNGSFIQSFDSIPLALEWLIKNGYTLSKNARNKIAEVCKGTRENAYGFKWEYYLDNYK